jgi:hypothetical protein
MLALQRARMPHRLLSVQADDLRVAAPQIGGMLREPPHGLELHVYCPSCYSTRRPVDLERWADRCFATARFRCTGRRHNGTPCKAPGVPIVRPAELLPVGGPVTLTFLTCPRCIWEINQAQLDKPPWSGSSQHYRCPGCAGRVEWHIHGPAWRPGSYTRNRHTSGDVRRL